MPEIRSQGLTFLAEKRSRLEEGIEINKGTVITVKSQIFVYPGARLNTNNNVNFPRQSHFTSRLYLEASRQLNSEVPSRNKAKIYKPLVIPLQLFDSSEVDTRNFREQGFANNLMTYTHIAMQIPAQWVDWIGAGVLINENTTALKVIDEGR